MVDRYRSLMGSQILNEDMNRNVRADQVVNLNREIVERTNSHATKMRKLIVEYRRNPSNEADRYITEFKEEQRSFTKDKMMLKDQLDRLEKASKKDTPQYNFMKKELLRSVKNEIDLDLELNQEINRRKQSKQLLKQKLMLGSTQIANAVKDIQAKKAQILYLQRSINECLKLLEIIGVLTNETGQKLDQISDRVKNANIQIERAEKNIDKAKIAMERSRCKMCCIIILALVVIIFILVVMFGLQIIP